MSKLESPTASGAAHSSASWSKAEMHFGMAKAAWKLAARNEHGAAMVIDHMERAIETLREMTPNARCAATAPEAARDFGQDPAVDLPRLVRLSRYQKMPDDGHGEWIGAPNNGGDVGDMIDIVEELNGLLIALHDAINRPKGVVPESAERFYQANARCAATAPHSAFSTVAEADRGS